MSKVYFTSDTHFATTNMKKFRKQFSSMEEHDAVILDNINSTLNKRDTLYILGDIAADAAATYEFLNKIRCENINVIMGNHDIFSKKDTRWMGLCNYIGGFLTYRNFWVSHCPIHPTEVVWRRGNIHGHTHSKNMLLPDGVIEDPRYFNVCLEQTDYKPIAFTRIEEIYNDRYKIVS